jgi:hypothetical protein
VNKKNPLELFEAQNAVQLAQVARADKYAHESFQQANEALQQALKYQQQKPGTEAGDHDGARSGGASRRRARDRDSPAAGRDAGKRAAGFDRARKRGT